MPFIGVVRLCIPANGRGHSRASFSRSGGDYEHNHDRQDGGSRNPKLDPPMVGSFSDGRGLFFGDDTFEGKPIRVRFIWSPLTYATCRWEQAFSQDGGETWETNWTMDFTHEPRCRNSQ